MTQGPLLPTLAVSSLFFLPAVLAYSQTEGPPDSLPPGVEGLPIGFGPGERERSWMIGQNRIVTPAPNGPVRAAAEWDESQGVFCLWDNAELMAEIVKDNHLHIITTDATWWNNWLASHSIPTTNVHYIYAKTNTWYTRDYGPWFIWDGNDVFGLVDNSYNRPRPDDDVIPSVISSVYRVPYFGMDLTHTGGNYYTDGRGNAWSTTLVYAENPTKAPALVDDIMSRYLGIERYVTPHIPYSIQHFDTFGKILAPDRMIWGQFPKQTTPWCWSESALKWLETLESAYGWPYKITRMPLWNWSSTWTAYINALQTNDKILLGKYGIPSDSAAAQIYQQVVPGYQAINIDAKGTNWGDSIHCRSRNFVKGEQIRIYAHPHWESTDDTVNPYVVTAEVIPDILTSLKKNPEILWTISGGAPFNVLPMTPTGNPDEYSAAIPAQTNGSRIDYYIHAEDQAGNSRNAPPVAPGGTFVIDIAPDSLPPDLDHDVIHGSTPSEWPLQITCTAIDGNGVPTVTLDYQLNGKPQSTVTLAREEGAFRFSGEMVGPVSIGDVISYRITATDGAVTPNSVSSPTSGWNWFLVDQTKPILVVELDRTPDSGATLIDICDDLGIAAQMSPAWPTTPSDFAALLICLGMNPTEKNLTSAQANSLVSYLNAGGNAYLEAGDGWAQASSASVYRSWFGLASASSGSDLSGTITGVAGQFTEGMLFGYGGENDSSDHLMPAAAADGILQTGSDVKAVAYDAGTYRTIAASFQVGTLVDRDHPSHMKLLVARYLDRLGFDIDLVVHAANTDSSKVAIDLKGDAGAQFALCLAPAPGHVQLPVGLLRIDPGTLLVAVASSLPASGEYHAGFNVPPIPSLDGLEVYFQAWMEQPGTAVQYLTNRDRVTLSVN